MKRLAVIGHPVAHSRSPAMQQAALAALGLADEWHYGALDIPPDRLAERLRELEVEGFVGANVTIPHKEAALELADTASEAAREIGAANTLSFADGEIAAENTDAPGLLAAIGPIAEGTRALVLGAGGSARAAVWALCSDGVDVEVWNRNAERAERLVAELGGAVRREGAARPDEFELLVNATPVGLGVASADAEPLAALKGLPIGAESIDVRHTVVDLTYGETVTPLIRLSSAAGASTVDGLEILVRQGAASLQIWTGTEPPLATMREAAVRAG